MSYDRRHLMQRRAMSGSLWAKIAEALQDHVEEVLSGVTREIGAGTFKMTPGAMNQLSCFGDIVNEDGSEYHVRASLNDKYRVAALITKHASHRDLSPMARTQIDWDSFSSTPVVVREVTQAIRKLG